MINNIRVGDRQEGASNFISWKIRITAILQELELEPFIEENKEIPNDETKMITWKRRNNKAKKLIIDGVKDHILPSISKLTTTYDVFKTIQDTFEITIQVDFLH